MSIASIFSYAFLNARRIQFNPGWAARDGYYDLLPRLDLQKTYGVGAVLCTQDEKDRKMIIITLPGQYGNVVIYQPDPILGNTLTYFAPEEIDAMYELSEELTMEELCFLLGDGARTPRNVGLRFNQMLRLMDLRAAQAKFSAEQAEINKQILND